MVAVIWIVLIVLALVCFLWFRRTPLYRAHRRIGVVQGQSGVGGVTGQSGIGNTPAWYGDRHVPPLLPELRADGEQPTRRVRRWRIERNRRPAAASAALAQRRRGRGPVKVFHSEQSLRRRTARQVGATADRMIPAPSVGQSLRRFLSPSAYPRGRVAGKVACVYFAATALVILSALPESSGGTLTVGLALVATLPLSVGVLVLQDDGAWTLAALAGCALVNAFVFWLLFRGDPA